MIRHFFQFFISLLLPYGLEQYSYWKFTQQPGKRQNQPGGKKVFGGYGLAYVWDAAHFTVFATASYKLLHKDQPLPFGDQIGLMLFWSGIALRIQALKELGQYYDSDIVLRDDHQVVTTGPYRYIRHPLHLGTLIQVTGLSFFAPIWLAIIMISASMLLTLYRNLFEDQILSQHLPALYAPYYKQTWDIVDLFFQKQQV